jgi:hypothetical protein
MFAFGSCGLMGSATLRPTAARAPRTIGVPPFLPKAAESSPFSEGDLAQPMFADAQASDRPPALRVRIGVPISAVPGKLPPGTLCAYFR